MSGLYLVKILGWPSVVYILRAHPVALSQAVDDFQSLCSFSRDDEGYTLSDRLLDCFLFVSKK